MKYRALKRAMKFRGILIQVIQIVVGTVIIAAAIALFLLPNQISTGGFSGISTIIYYLFKIPMGFSLMVLNIPLFITAFIKGGKKYFFSALFGTAMLSVFLNIFEGFKPLTQDRLLAAIYGGVTARNRSCHYIKSRSIYRWHRAASKHNKNV